MTIKSTKSTKATNKSTKSTKATDKSARRRAKAPRVRERAPKAAVEREVSTSAIDADDALDAANNAKAPKGSGMRACYLQWLAKTSKESSVSYANSMRRPVGAFVDWCAAKDITRASALSTGALEKYRASVEKQGYALSTQRMALARVQTFLRFLDVGADLKVLRLQHTAKEKKHLAALAAEREVAA
jgi:hypothetical protein